MCKTDPENRYNEEGKRMRDSENMSICNEGGTAMLISPQFFHEQLMENMRPSMRYTGGDFGAWKTSAREKLISLLGLPEKNCESDVIKEWEKQEDGYRETRYTFQTEKGFRNVFHILMPDGVLMPRPVICLQGHSKGMHISLSRPRYEGDAETIAGGRDFAIQAVRRGFAAIALEQRAFGELGGDENGPRCQQPAMTALLLGRTLLGERVFDVMRLVDVLFESFGDRLNLEKICLTGNSGGATVTAYTAALDDRISVSAPSCAVSSYLHSIGNQVHCACNYVPGIYRYFDMAEICLMAAPRAQIIMNGQFDVIFPHDKAHEQYEIARKTYAALGAEDKIIHLVGPEGHRYYPDLAWPSIEKYMNE